MRSSSISRRVLYVMLLALVPLFGPSWGCSHRHVAHAPKVGGTLTPLGRAGSLHHGRLPDGTVPKHYDIALAIDPNQERFLGQVSIAVEMLEPQDTLLLHASHLDIQKVAVMDGLGRRHKVDLASDANDISNELLRLHFSPPMPAGMATIYLSYSAAFATEPEGLYRREVGGHFYVQSQMQPTGARRVLPCFDEPRFRTPFTVVLTVPSDVTCLSSSQTVGVRDAHAGHRAWAFESTPPLPTDLLGFTVGPLVGSQSQLSVSPQRPYTLDVRSYGAKNTDLASMSFASRRLTPLMQDLEAYVDMPYPFSKLDLVAAQGLGYRAINSAALLTLRESLVMSRGAQASYSSRRAFEMAAAWGLSAQWFGAWVNNAWWDDVWLHTSLANWRGLRAAHHTRPGMQFDLEQAQDSARAMDHDGFAEAPRVRADCRTKDDIQAAYGPHIMGKGVAVLTMFEHSVGKDRFREGVRTYLRRYPYQSTTTASFLAALSEGAAAPELIESFHSFLNQPGVPEITFAWQCSGGGATLTISQERYRPLGATPVTGTWSLPVCFRTGNAQDHRPRHPTCVQLTEGSTEVHLQGCPHTLVPNADGVGYYRSKVAYEQLPEVLRAITPTLMTPQEFFVAIDNLAAALASGSLPADSALAGIALGLRHPNPRVVSHALHLMAHAFEQYVQPGDAPAAAQSWRKLLAVAQHSLVASIKQSEPSTDGINRVGAEADAIADRRDELALLRHHIIWAQASLAQDLGTQANLAHAGAHWLDAQETARRIAPPVAPQTSSPRPHASLMADDVALALAHGAKAFGDPFVGRMLRLLADEKDSVVRRHLLVGLSSLPLPSSLQPLLELTVSPLLQGQERLSLLHDLMAHPQLRPAVWSFVVHHMPTLLTLIPVQHQTQLIELGASLCDGDGQSVIQSAVAPHLPLITGGEGALRLALERNTVCAAQVAAQSSAVTQFFMEMAGSSPAP